MILRDKASGRATGVCRLALVVALFVPGTAEAGLTLISSSAETTYSLNDTNPDGPGSARFSSSGMLVAPGGGLPRTLVSGDPPNGTFQIGTARSLTPPFTFTSSTRPQSGVVGTVPARFGTATTALFAQGAGQQGTLLTQGGLFFDTRTRLSDNLGPNSVNEAAVSFTSSTATFRNETGADIRINPASLLSVQGTLGDGDTSYVAAGLTTSFTISGSSTITLAPIVLAATRPNIAFGVAGTSRNDALVAINLGGRLFATGSSSLNTSVTLRNGQSISIQSGLTLISDPGSFIQIDSNLAPLPPGFQFNQDFFGVHAGGAFSAFAVPEPSAVAMLGLGLATSAGWRLLGRARRPSRG